MTPDEEELVLYWYDSRGCAQFTHPIFKGNFEKQFMKNYKGKDFDKFDFTEMYKYIEKSRLD